MNVSLREDSNLCGASVLTLDYIFLPCLPVTDACQHLEEVLQWLLSVGVIHFLLIPFTHFLLSLLECVTCDLCCTYACPRHRESMLIPYSHFFSFVLSHGNSKYLDRALRLLSVHQATDRVFHTIIQVHCPSAPLYGRGRKTASLWLPFFCGLVNLLSVDWQSKCTRSW